MVDYRSESKDCDLNVLNDILDNIDDQAYIDDDEENEDTSKSDHQKTSNPRNASDKSRLKRRLGPVARNEDNLKKLEQERKRLELENEEIKRQVEELKRQEHLMEQAAWKGDYTGNNLKELTGKTDGSDKRAKKGNSADAEAENHEIEEHVQDKINDSDLDHGPESDEDQISESSLSHKDEEGAEHSSGETTNKKQNSGGSGRNNRHRLITSPLSPFGKRHRSDSRSSRHKKKRRDSSLDKNRRRHSPLYNHGRGRHRSSSRELNAKLRYVFRDAKYFLIKSSNHENVALAQAKGVWSSPPPNEMRINQAFRAHSNVILIFSVKESGKFQGFARVASESDRNHPPIRWVLPVGISARMLSGVFTLDWINRNELEFDRTLHIRNSFNEGCAVKIGRDGQEIDPVAGEEVCRLFAHDRHIDLFTIAQKAKQTLKLNGIAPLVEPRGRSPWNAPFYRNERHNRHDRQQERNDRNSRWSNRRSRSPGRRPVSMRYSHHSDREGHEGRLDDFRGFRHKMGLPPPLPPPGFMPPPVYGHMHPPPPPPPFIFDRLSRGQPSRHMMDKRSGRHDDEDFAYRSSRDSRNHPYDRQPRDRR